MERAYEFADEKEWSDQRLKERAQHLNEHAQIVSGERNRQVNRELDHALFEITMRSLIIDYESELGGEDGA